MITNQPAFPSDFVWGVGTSCYQIEGAVAEDGKGPSVWDDFCQTPHKVSGGDTGETACDHYHRYHEDVELMRELHIPNYRFSISWPRLLPDGKGAVNRPGLDFYDSLVDTLLAHQIQPWVTLFHWDYPSKLQKLGGWLNPESPGWFADYARVVVERLSDRVRHWITINEPQSFMRFGHVDGTNAPGLELSLPDRLLACHHVLLAHGRAVETIRETAKLPPLVGWAPVGVAAMPESCSEADSTAAQQAMAEVPETLWSNIWFNDPVFLGEYPAAGLQAFGRLVPNYTTEEMQTISSPLDFLGLNIYTGTIVRATKGGGFTSVTPEAGWPHTAFDWPVYEESLYWGPKFYWERYKTPLYITENGMANIDWVDLHGEVSDPQRIDYLSRYLAQLQRGIEEGIDVQGYFLWSLLDNFEWAEGFSKRFGLIHVNFQSQQRIPKQSAYWYRDLIRSQGQPIKG